jgi:hypothetical protein
LWRAFSTSSWATPRFRSSWWNRNIFQSLWDLSKEKRGNWSLCLTSFNRWGPQLAARHLERAKPSA